jgi:hypothetical protein
LSPPEPGPSRPFLGIPVPAWIIVGASLPVHLALALGTDLSPDEAYYLCAARRGAMIPDHPPLTLWLLSVSDRWPLGPVELRVRIWALVLSLVTGLAVVALARARGAGPEGCTLAAWAGSWALLPTAGGFVTTPDTFLLPAIAGALLLATPPEGASGSAPTLGRTVLGLLAMLAAALAKVVALPIGIFLALSGRRVSPAVRLGLALGPLVALPWIGPSLFFQLRHAYGGALPGGWSAGEAGAAVLAAVGAQAALWSPLLLWRGLRALRRAPAPDLTLVAGLSALIVGSALVRAVPPEPNWWAPAALAVIAAAAADVRDLAVGTRRAILVTVLLPTAIAGAHTLHPFLPLPAPADPTARLHGWSGAGPEPVEAGGVGPYGPAAERCVYRGQCDEITFYFDRMDIHERSRR